MSTPINSLLNFWHGGLDQDDAPIRIALGDYISGYNIRNSGTTSGEDGYTTNIESNVLIGGNLHAGLNKIVGGIGFEEIRAGIIYIYNSFGYHQIGKVDYDTKTLTIIFENLTDSAGEDVLPLTSENYVLDIRLINDTYLLWNDAVAPIGFTNLNTLEDGGYGTVLEEDFSLIKPQSLAPITGDYISDTGKASNFLKNKLFQFSPQWVGYDFTKSAWGTWSQRIIPLEESTPAVGTDVTQNNGIVLNVPAGSIRVQTLNIAARVGTEIFNIIKTVDRADIVALPDTEVDIPNGIYEAYDQATNIYQFVFYNEDLSIPVDPIETDLLYDYIWPAGAMEVVNGNIVALGDLHVGYPRPNTSATLSSVGYDPNINIPYNPLLTPLTVSGSSRPAFANSPILGYVVTITIGGIPATDDKIIIIYQNTQNASDTRDYSYTVPSGQDGDLAAVVQSTAEGIPGASYVLNINGTYTISALSDPFFKLQTAAVSLFNAGPTVSRSIHTILDNSSYQLALAYYDKWGRAFPLDTNNIFIVNTPSYAQVNGQAIEIDWTINTANAPTGAVSYQWLITPNNTVEALLDVLSTPLVYVDEWDAHTNMPALAAGTGTVGDTYQITTASLLSDERNLGNGQVAFNTGDYVVYNGLSWDIVPKAFGDLTTSGNILALKINPLAAFNQKYTNSGTDTVLSYDFVDGDRCTLHYYIDGSTKIFINDPCVDLNVYGYDAATSIVKLEKSATFDESTIAGKDVFVRLYSPKPKNENQANTVWYEVGLRYTITNGIHDTLTGKITQGDVYYKTRQYTGAIDPNSAYEVLAVDFNFSDFYPSAFWSNGRPRSYYDELEETERKAVIAWSQSYVLGSRNNGLTRFYPANVYGTAGGETSANYGAIVKMLQVNNELVVIQQLNHGSVPVYQTIYTDQLDTKTVAVSQKLFNPIRYTVSKHIGIGNAKESVAIYNNVIYWIDPNRSQPVRWQGDGCFPISLKMTKYFKSTLQVAFAAGLKIIGWYDIFNDEYVISIQQPGGIISIFPFTATAWRYLATYTIAPGDITITGAPAHSTPSYDTGTGIVTLTPDTDYVGSDTLQISFNPGTGVITKNACFNWIAGSGDVNPFSFAPVAGALVSTPEESNTISVFGNDFPVAISITGDTGLGYSINGGAYTSAPGTVSAGDVVSVRVTSSASNGVLTSCTLTIDSQSAEFDVVTRLAGNYTVYGKYGMGVSGVADGTTTGTPAILATQTVNNNESFSTAYTATGGAATTIVVDCFGIPVSPGHVEVFLSVGGVTQDHQSVGSGSQTKTLTFISSAADPTAVVVGFQLV